MRPRQYRIAFPGQAARKVGLDVHVLHVNIPITAWGPPRPELLGSRQVLDVDPPQCDVLVVQRPLNLDFVEALEIIRYKYGVRVVVDIDDDFFSLHPNNAAYASVHPKLSPLSNWNHLRRGLAVADVITVTTPALAERLGPKCIVVPNCIPAAMLDLPNCERSEPLVGWSGSVRTHPGDLAVTRGAIARTVPIERFRVAGPAAGVGQQLGYERDPVGTGWQEFRDYFRMLAKWYDIGIIPLADTAFNASKSCLKSAEHSACGIPVVMSPTPDNLRLHADGIGIIAQRPREWVAGIKRLMDDGERIEMGGKAREIMRRHTIEANIDRWCGVWTDVAASR